MNFGRNTNEKGITLIALVVTIIVLLILAGISISMLTGENGILTKTNVAKVSTELSTYKEELNSWKLEQLMKNEDFFEDTLSAGKNNLYYNGIKQNGNIKTIIQDISDEYIDELEIIKGELVINTTDKSKLEASKIAQISSNPYIIVDGELKSAGANLDLMSSDGTLTIPENVTKIGSGAFSNVSNIKTVIISGNVKEIGDNAFAYNTTLQKVVLQDGIEKIGSKAFYQCYNLSQLDLPDTITSIGEFAIANTKLTTLEIPSGLKIINEYTFYGLLYLETLNIPEGIEELRSDAFGSANRLEYATIPSTITYIDSNAFSNCPNLVNITINSDKFVYESGMILPKDKSEVIFLSKRYLENTDTLVIPEGITRLALYLDSYDNLKIVNIPKSLIYMREGCLPYTVEKINVAEGNANFYVYNNQLYSDKKLILSYTKQERVTVKERNNFNWRLCI